MTDTDRSFFSSTSFCFACSLFLWKKKQFHFKFSSRFFRFFCGFLFCCFLSHLSFVSLQEKKQDIIRQKRRKKNSRDSREGEKRREIIDCHTHVIPSETCSWFFVSLPPLPRTHFHRRIIYSFFTAAAFAWWAWRTATASSTLAFNDSGCSSIWSNSELSISSNIPVIFPASSACIEWMRG